GIAARQTKRAAAGCGVGGAAGGVGDDVARRLLIIGQTIGVGDRLREAAVAARLVLHVAGAVVVAAVRGKTRQAAARAGNVIILGGSGALRGRVAAEAVAAVAIRGRVVQGKTLAVGVTVRAVLAVAAGRGAVALVITVALTVGVVEQHARQVPTARSERAGFIQTRRA